MAEVDELERRISAVEVGQEKLVVAVADLKTEAHETRQEQTAMLKGIAAEVKSISEKQTIQAGIEIGIGRAQDQAKGNADRRDKWALAGVAIVSGFLVWAATTFVDERVSLSRSGNVIIDQTP